ncbi:DUF1273 domain-containing protein [Bacillus salitolerans]|uniref:UPF0398 protein ACFSCX_18290 n=1 Tax=Bacillus salitolerans TaxID=1437434 RepID=A0ABW4LUJ8_9BACI
MTKVVAITGYKSFELGIFKQDHIAIQYIKRAFRKRLLTLIEGNLEWILISGQLGTELWVAEEIFDLQTEFPNVKLAVLTPYLDQESKWNDFNKEQYEFIVSQADFVDSITKRPYENPGQLKAKNQFIIQKSDALIAFYDDEKQGSPLFMIQEAKRRAEREDYPIILITPLDIEELILEDKYSDPANWSS